MKLPEGTIFKRKGREGYWWKFTWKGRRRTLSAGKTKADAQAFRRRFWDKLREQERTGQKPIEPVKFEDFVPVYLEHAAKTKAETTMYRERSKLEGVLLERFGKKEVHTMSQADIVRWLDGRDVTVATRNRDLSQLSAFFKHAIMLGHARENPVKGIPRPKERLKPIPYVEEKVQNAFLDEVPEDLRPFCVLAVDTGMRSGELLALEWRDVNLSEASILVRDSKTKKPREIPMTPRVRQQVVELSEARSSPRRGSDRVFAHLKKTWGGHLAARLKRPGKKVGIEGMTVHTMRHWFTTNLVRRGVPLGDIARLTGHSTMTMLLRYGSHSPQDATKKAIAALADAALAREGEVEYRMLRRA
jgi:integrase